MANKDKVLRQLNTALLVRDVPVGTGGGGAVLTAASNAGSSTLNLSGATGFSNGDTVRIGSGSDMELGVISTLVSLVVTLVEPLVKNHAQGQVVIEQLAYDLGDIADGGANVQITSQGTDVAVATKRLAFTRLNGYANLSVDIGLPTVTIEGIAFALGIPLANVTGNGASSTTPKTMVTDGTEISAENNVSLILLGVTMDGTAVRFELWAIDPDYTGFSLKLQRGVNAVVPAKFNAGGGGVAAQSTSSYVANTTYRPSKLKTFDALTEVGLFTNAGGATLSTTVGAPSAGSNVAGQAVLTVASVTNLHVGTWLKIGTGDTVEFHKIISNVTTQLTLDGPLYRNIVTGVTVIEQTLTPFATVAPDGVTIGISGSVDTINEATTRLSIGTKPGAARVTASFAFIDFLLASIARAAGIDVSLIANNRVLLGNSIGLAQIDGIYIKGTLQDGSTAWFNMWGCSQDVSNMAVRLTDTGVQTVPISFLPNSGIQFMQHV